MPLMMIYGARHRVVNCPGTNDMPGQFDKFCIFIEVIRVIGAQPTKVVNDPSIGNVGPKHIPQATPIPKSPKDIVTILNIFCAGVKPIKTFVTVGIAVDVIEIFGYGIGMGIGPGMRHTSGNPIFITIILFENMDRLYSCFNLVYSNLTSLKIVVKSMCALVKSASDKSALEKLACDKNAP